MKGFNIDIDSPLMRALSKLADLMVINLITLALCVPIVTAGAALTAMHYVLLKLARDEETYVVKMYFHSFKENFAQATGLWMIYLIIFLILGTDIFIMRRNPDLMPEVLSYIIIFIAALVFMCFQYAFPLESHFVNTVRNTFRNSFLLGFSNLPRSILMAVTWLIPLIFVRFIQLFPLLILFGITLPAYISAKIYSPIFRKMEPKEPEEENEETLADIDDTALDELAADLGADRAASDDKANAQANAETNQPNADIKQH